MGPYDDDRSEADELSKAIEERVRQLGEHYERDAGLTTNYARPNTALSHSRAARALVAAMVCLLVGGTILLVVARNRESIASPAASTEGTAQEGPTFGTMPDLAAGVPIDPSNIPDYISVIDNSGRSYDIVGYVKNTTMFASIGPSTGAAETSVPPNSISLPPDPPRGLAIQRIYDRSLNVVGYLVPDVGAVLLPEAAEFLNNPDYYVDPAS